MKNKIMAAISAVSVFILACSVNTYAFEAKFNSVRININGIDTVQWGEEIVFDDLTATPYSIVYQDTTYLPVRKISEFLNKNVSWDGTTNTVYIYSDKSISIQYGQDTSVLSENDFQDSIFNRVNINIDGINKVDKGTYYTLSDGSAIPYSILYNGTTYLPMRKLCELLNKEIYWNGDSRTVYVTDQTSGNEYVTEAYDANGNKWKYYTFKSEDKNYLGVKDENRNFERVYSIVGGEVYVSEDGIYFAKKTKENAYHYEAYADLTKILFENDQDSQDGETICSLTPLSNDSIVFDDHYVIYAGDFPSTNAHITISVYNCITGDKVSYDDWSGIRVNNIDIIPGDDTITVNYDMDTISTSGVSGSVVFDKTKNAFTK